MSEDASSSELSSAPASPEVKKTTRQSVGNRKRGDAPTASSIKVEAATTRRSPRKALKREPLSDDEHANKTPKKPRRQPAKRITGSPSTSEAIEPPPKWEEVYTTTQIMRKRLLAPVDTMGCEALAEETRAPLDRRLQTLIALMLSSQTKDTVTAAAMTNLQQNLPGGFTLSSLLAVPAEDFNKLIEKVGFHNNKTKYIKATAILLEEKWGSDIPDTIEGLISLPGVGPKMAYLCMSAAWGRTEGIGVDVHVHRITNLWGWHETRNPEETRKVLEAWLPREKWHEINHLLVGLGQTVCLPVGRKCGECDLSIKGLCPSAVEGKSPRKRKVKKEVEVYDGEVKLEGNLDAQADDVGVKVEAATEEIRQVEVQTATGAGAGAVQDIEDI